MGRVDGVGGRGVGRVHGALSAETRHLGLPPDMGVLSWGVWVEQVACTQAHSR